MGRRKKKKQDSYEYYYCQIEEWSRFYSFGVDYSNWSNPDKPFREWNMATLDGRVRHITTDVPNRRKYDRLHLLFGASSNEEEDFGSKYLSFGSAQGTKNTLMCFFLTSSSLLCIFHPLSRDWPFQGTFSQGKEFQVSAGTH